MPAKKPADRRQNRVTHDAGEVVTVLPTVVAQLSAAADLTWRDEVQQQWAELWSSQLAGAFKPSDMPALRRLFDYRSRLVEALERFDDAPMVPGSMGQPVMSPWAAEVHRLEATIQKLEDKCGLTPMARLRLGITFVEGMSLAERNAQILAAFRQSSG